jgi:hypothetical protein
MKYFIQIIIVFSFASSVRGQEWLPEPTFDSLKIVESYKNEKLKSVTVNVTDTLFDSYPGTSSYKLLHYRFNCFINSNGLLLFAFNHPNDTTTAVYYFRKGLLDKVLLYIPGSVYEAEAIEARNRLFLLYPPAGFITKILEKYKF